MRELILNFTNYCNSKCVTCSVWKYTEHQWLGIPEFKKILQSSYLDDLMVTYITGGEPFASDYCLQICQAVKDIRPQSIIRATTNALEPEKYFERIIKINKDIGLPVIIVVSINGNKEIHDKSRGINGSYDSCIRLLELLRDKNINRGISFLMYGDNKDQLPHVTHLSEQYGAGLEWGYARSAKYYNLPDIKGEYRDFDCPCTDWMFSINPNGDVVACLDSDPNLIIGNLYKQEVHEMRWKEVQQYVKDRRCQPCSWSCFYGRRKK